MAPATEKNQPANWHFERGQALYERGYYPGAAAEFRKAADIDPANADVFVAWGRALGDNQDAAGAIERYKKASQLDPARADSHFLCAEALSGWAETSGDSRRYDEAREEYALAIQADSTNIDAYEGQATALSALGRWKEAIEAYEKIIEAEPDRRVYPGLAKAIANLAAGEQAAAVRELEARFTSDPRFATALMRWGDALAAQQKYDDAIRLYRKATQVDSALPTPYIHWGRALWKKGQFEEGLTTCLKPVESGPADPSFVTSLARSLVDLDEQQAAAAVEKLNRAIHDNAARAALYRAWGDSLVRKKRHAEAVARYQDALRIDPGLVDALVGLADALAAQAQYDDAIGQYSHASSLQPESASIYLKWAEALSSQDQFDKAAEQYEQAIDKNLSDVDFEELLDLLAKLNPRRKEQTLGVLEAALVKREDAERYASWASALAAKENYSEAIAQYDKALALDANAAGTWRSKGEAQVNLYDYSAAVQSYRRVTELDPYDWWAYLQCGYALVYQGKYPDAIECYKLALEIKPDSSDVYDAWGWASYSQDNYDDAIKQYQTAIAIDSTSTSAHYNFGSVLAAQGMYDDAIAQYRKAIELNPEDGSPYLDWGNALATAGAYAEAIQKCEEAAGKFPDFAYAYHNIAWYLWAEGDYQNGRTAWQKAGRVYESTRQKSENKRNPEFFRYYGSVLYENLWEPEKAQQVFEEGLKINPKHTGMLGSLASLHLDRLDELHQGTSADAERPGAYAKAREYYKRAEGILNEKLRMCETSSALQELGDLHLKMGEYDEAQTCLEKAHQRNLASSDINVSLGVLCSRREDFRRAARYFEAARRRDRNELNVWSNLAETYLKIDPKDVSQIEKAETEFRQILRIAPDHIDSQIGLAEVYTAKAEAGEKDFYSAAIRHYGRAIELSDKHQGSKRLSSRQLAGVYYSLGYARVRLYEASRPFGDESLLSDALQSFQRCASLDRDHHKAETAKDKLDKLLNKRPLRWIPEKVAPWLVLGPSLFVLITTQVTFVFGFPRLQKPLDTASYIALTFGSLIFVVVGLFLPEIQKLKGAGIELEKSTVTQISTSGSLGITK